MSAPLGSPPPPGPHLLREDPACLGHEAREGKLGRKVEVHTKDKEKEMEAEE